MKTKTLIPALLIGIGLFTACERENSSDVNQDRVYAEYRIVYDSETDISYARATFRFGSATGTLLELESPAHVEFNSVNLPWQNALAYYEKEYVGPLNSGMFKYSDLDGNVYDNSCTLTSSIQAPASLDTIYQSGAYALVWDGPALDVGEIVYVTITDGSISRTWSESSATETQIILDQSKLQDLDIGSATLYIERWEGQPLSEGTDAGGAVWSRYKGIDKTITIMP